MEKYQTVFFRIGVATRVNQKILSELTTSLPPALQLLEKPMILTANVNNLNNMFIVGFSF